MMEFEFFLCTALVLALLLCAAWTLSAWSDFSGLQAEALRIAFG